MEQRYLFWAALLPISIEINIATAEEISTAGTTDTMVVTAGYWPTSGSDIPASQTIISREQLDTPINAGIEHLSQFVSNTQIEDSTIQRRVIIRGQSSIDAGQNSPVGYILDDVSLPLGVRQAPDLLNIEMLEVIKGAQGSFYGRNTEAGVLKVTSTLPEPELSGWSQYSYLQSSGGNGQSPGHQLQTGISGGNETLATSVALAYEQIESPYYNLYRQSDDENQKQQLHVQGNIAYQLNDRTDVLYRMHWQDKDSGRATMRYLTGTQATDRFDVNQNTPTDNDEKTVLHSLRIDHEFATATLTAITGYTQYRQDFTMDPDSSVFSVTSATNSLTDDEMFSQEIRLSGIRDNDVKWAAGTYLYQQDTHNDFTMGYTGIRRVTDNAQWGSAGFGHLQIPLGEKWTLTTGMRLEYTRQKGHQTGVGIFDKTLTETEWLPHLAAGYQMTPQQALYARWSTGYLPGGFNYGYSSTTDNFSYAAEHTHAFELGHRGSWFKQQMHTEMTLFYHRISDKQITDIQPGMVQEISNAASADIYGLESSLDWQLNTDWSLTAALGLQHGEADDPQIHGKSLPYTPDYTWSFGIGYSPLDSLTTELLARGSHHFYFDSDNTLRQDNYQLVDLNVRYRWRPVTFTIAVNNLFDETLYSRAVSSMTGMLVEDTQPRTISFSANYQW